MIPHGVEIYLALKPIDLRWSFDRLAGVAREQLGRNARCGALFVYYNRRRTSLKVLFFDGSGLCQFYKRLDRGTFRIPGPLLEGETSVTLTERELDDLLDGITVEPTKRRRRKKKPTLH
jgi:transposase